MDPLICPPGAEAVAEASWRWQREFAGFLSVNTQCAQPSLALQAAQHVAQSFALVCPISPFAQPERPTTGQVAVGGGVGPGRAGQWGAGEEALACAASYARAVEGLRDPEAPKAEAFPCRAAYWVR